MNARSPETRPSRSSEEERGRPSSAVSRRPPDYGVAFVDGRQETAVQAKGGMSIRAPASVHEVAAPAVQCLAAERKPEEVTDFNEEFWRELKSPFYNYVMRLTVTLRQADETESEIYLLIEDETGQESRTDMTEMKEGAASHFWTLAKRSPYALWARPPNTHDLHFWYPFTVRIMDEDWPDADDLIDVVSFRSPRERSVHGHDASISWSLLRRPSYGAYYHFNTECEPPHGSPAT